MSFSWIVDRQLVHGFQVHKFPRQTELIFITNIQATMQQEFCNFGSSRHIADFFHIDDWHTANAEVLNISRVLCLSDIVVVVIRAIRELYLDMIKRLTHRFARHQDRVITYVQNIILSDRNRRRRSWYIITISTTCSKVRIRNDI